MTHISGTLRGFDKKPEPIDQLHFDKNNERNPAFDEFKSSASSEFIDEELSNWMAIFFEHRYMWWSGWNSKQDEFR